MSVLVDSLFVGRIWIGEPASTELSEQIARRLPRCSPDRPAFAKEGIASFVDSATHRRRRRHAIGNLDHQIADEHHADNDGEGDQASLRVVSVHEEGKL